MDPWIALTVAAAVNAVFALATAAYAVVARRQPS